MWEDVMEICTELVKNVMATKDYKIEDIYTYTNEAVAAILKLLENNA